MTQLSIGLTVALGGAFAALAAGSTHPKKVVRVAVPRARVAVLVDAPAPPLVGGQSSAPTPSSAPVAPAAAPTPTYVSPVVVSGGS